MPIRFDDAAADEVVAQLELTAGSLRDLAGRLAQAAPIAAEDWQGRFRHTFDVELARHLDAAQQWAADLHLVAVAVRALQLEAQVARAAAQATASAPATTSTSHDHGAAVVTPALTGLRG